MKITFTFSTQADLASTWEGDIYKSYFEFPDEALQLPDCKERILAIAHAAGELTQGALFITCKELGLKNQFIKPVTITDQEKSYIRLKPHTIVLVFQNYGTRAETRKFRILMPVPPPLPYIPTKRGTLIRSLIINLNFTRDKNYNKNLQQIADNCLILLKVDARQFKSPWKWNGFHPSWYDNSLAKQLNKRSRKAVAEQRKKERLEQKRLKAQSENIPVEEGKATKRGRAVPGIFQGVQMRSQLEIRLAAELEKRNIRWKYEPERLGESNYLVDFYLPDYKCWIEVKGSFEPRDEFLLPEIAKMLEQERSEKLYVYTASNIFYVKNGQFKAMIKEDFWKLFTG